MSFGHSSFGHFFFGDSRSYELNQDELDFLTIAKGAIPPEFFSDENQEIFYAYAKQFGMVKRRVIDADIRRATLSKSYGIWLDQLAKDRGTARQAGEDDKTLITRLKKPVNAVTASSMVRANNINAVYVGTTTADTAYKYTIVFTNSQNGNIQAVGSATIQAPSSLDSSDYVYLQWEIIGTGQYDIYRQIGSGSPYIIDSVFDMTNSYTDIGTTGTLQTPPTYDITDPLGIVTQILILNNIELTVGYPVIVEVRQSKMIWRQVGSNYRGFWSRGLRYNKTRNTIVIILPPGSEGLTAVIKEAVFRIKGAGVSVQIEVAP